jgi:predicted DNA-binding protein with PD1-like motif
MRSKALRDGEERTFVVVYDSGEELVSGLLLFARQHSLTATRLSAIGALSGLTVGFFDLHDKDYARIEINEQVELLSLIGTIGRHEDGSTRLHAHVAVSKRDGSALGGHLIEAYVRPTVEVMAVESQETLVRRDDDATGLPLLAP